MAVVSKIVVRSSDLSGAEGADTLVVKTLTFKVPGFTLDVTEAEREDILARIAELESAVADLVRDTLGDELDAYAALNAAGANTTGGAAQTGGKLDVIRAWGRKHGFTVADRGRISADLLNAFKAANGAPVADEDEADDDVQGIGWDPTADEPSDAELAAIDAE